MTLRTQQPQREEPPAVLSDEQRRRVADALENAQSENTRRNYASQFEKFRIWCEQQDYSPLPHSPRFWLLTPWSLRTTRKACPRCTSISPSIRVSQDSIGRWQTVQFYSAEIVVVQHKRHS